MGMRRINAKTLQNKWGILSKDISKSMGNLIKNLSKAIGHPSKALFKTNGESEPYKMQATALDEQVLY